jgi:phosphoglycolate phosphatase (TIGR01487 family)
MRYLVLATDYDGTLAEDGKVSHETVAALDRFLQTGRKLVLVTGRHLPDLRTIFRPLDLFARVVVENGGLLYRPDTREEKLLCGSPDQRLLDRLKERNIPFELGRAVVATWRPHENVVRDAIRDVGLNLEVTLNKGSVMVLPSGIDKATGLQHALNELGISLHNVVAVGDAENDNSLLRISACGVAVANALPSLKEHADIVLDSPRGAGVVELIDEIIANDLSKFDEALRHSVSRGGSRDQPGNEDGSKNQRSSLRPEQAF